MQKSCDVPGSCTNAQLSTRRSQQVPIHALLTIPNLIQIAVVVALTGGLSWWYGQQTIQRLAFQLQQEMSDRVQLKLSTYLAAPRLITQLNQNAVQLGQLDLNNTAAVERHLFHQLMEFESVSGVLIGTEQGTLRAVNRRDGLHLLQLDSTNQGKIHDYALSAQGEKQQLLGTFTKPDLRKSPWYQSAVKAGTTVWSPIFQTADNRDLSLNANTPITDPQSGALLGVASSGVVLSGIDEFLDKLQVSPSGLVFLVERNGKLIGTSVDTPSYQMQLQGNKVMLSQVVATASEHRLIRDTAQQLLQRFGQFSNITEVQQLTFSQTGKQEFVRVVPYRDELGLDWLIVVVIPEADLMADLHTSQRNTLLLCLAATAIAILLGLLVSRFITRPMRQLSQASQAIAAGDLNQRLPEDMPIREMQVTAQAFNQMASQLERSFQQVAAANTNLEAQVQEQTTQLRQALAFEDLLRGMTEKVRDSLDEAQILQTAVQELAIGLAVQGCDVALYDLDNQTATVLYEHRCDPDLISTQGKSFSLTSLPELYQQLQHQHSQFCWLQPIPESVRNVKAESACLACPLQDDQGALGDLWLFKPKQQAFSAEEIRLVQQVANQCAIALRQSRLYQTAQAQVVELEQLHRVKDDFLNTVSHELRTPMANIKMATQLLEMQLERIIANGAADPTLLSSVYRYLQILTDEGQREITLINNLLDLSRLEAGSTPYLPSTIDPNRWIAQIVTPFTERAKSQHQQFQLELQPNLPPLTTDLGNLERILSELVNNACKYTPSGERIVVSARFDRTATATAMAQSPGSFVLSVTNSGAEIPEAERDRIFEKFYRIPTQDLWKQGGTGLGLALVKGLVERLSGSIQVNSRAGVTTFQVLLPIDPSQGVSEGIYEQPRNPDPA